MIQNSFPLKSDRSSNPVPAGFQNEIRQIQFRPDFKFQIRCTPKVILSLQRFANEGCLSPTHDGVFGAFLDTSAYFVYIKGF